MNRHDRLTCKHCGAKKRSFYIYKGDITGRSFQVSFFCGRIVNVQARTGWRKETIKECPNQQWSER